MDLGPMNVGHGSTHEICCPPGTSGVPCQSRHSVYFSSVPQADFPYPGVCELVAHMAQLSRAPHMPSSAAIVSKDAVISVNSAPLMEYPLEYSVVPIPLC
jgi:hypothetical protein